jgi:SP family sugar:H+ symporter-like MFS transporter
MQLVCPEHIELRVLTQCLGYKYYIVYMPLVIIQWILIWKCESPNLVTSAGPDGTTDMVETRGYTLEEVAFAFDGPKASLAIVGLVPNFEQESYEDGAKSRNEDKSV